MKVFHEVLEYIMKTLFWMVCFFAVRHLIYFQALFQWKAK